MANAKIELLNAKKNELGNEKKYKNRVSSYISSSWMKSCCVSSDANSASVGDSGSCTWKKSEQSVLVQAYLSSCKNCNRVMSLPTVR